MCQKEHWKDHKVLCKAIQYLDANKKECETVDSGHFVTHLNPKQRMTLVRLVGRKCSVKCYLNDQPVEVLWDTGAQVSIVPESLLKRILPDVPIKDISELVNMELNLTAANGTAIPYKGWVDLRFRLSSPENELLVPFLVTDEILETPLVGYNVIEEIIQKKGGNESLQHQVADVNSAFTDLNENDSQALVNFIQEAKEVELCSVKTTKRNVIIPKGETVKIPCRVNTGPVERRIPVLFEPEATAPWPSGLEVAESLLIIDRGKSSQVNIEVVNSTSHDITVKSRTTLGHLNLVQSVTPLEVRLRESIPDDHANQREAREHTSEHLDPLENSPVTLPTHLQNIELGGLSEEQKHRAMQMLSEEGDSFATGDHDIGCIEDLKMDIKLTDPTPVQKNYVAVPRPLYPEVKSYIEDLLNRQFIKRSSSSYSSPVVCVRKKDKSLRLCVDYRELNKRTVPDRHPIPRIQETLDNLGGNSWFSVLDQGKAYHQGFINADSQPLTAFITPWGLYEWVRIPFGLSNALHISSALWRIALAT